MAPKELIKKHQIFGQPTAMQAPVKEVRIDLTAIPGLFYSPKGPKKIDSSRDLRRWKGTSAHDHIEERLALESGETPEEFFPTLPEHKLLDIEDILSDRRDVSKNFSPPDFNNLPPSAIRDEKNPQQPYIYDPIPAQDKRTAWRVATHGLRTSEQYAEKVRRSLPPSGTKISEATMLFRLGGCNDGLQVVVTIRPDFVTFIEPTFDSHTTHMVAVHDLKNFPVRKTTEHNELGIDIDVLLRQLTIAAFANISNLYIQNRVQRSDNPGKFTDYDRLFKDSDRNVKERLRSLRRNPYAHFDGSHKELHISKTQGFEVSDEIRMSPSDVIDFLSSPAIRIVISKAKQKFRTEQRQKPPSQKAKGSKTIFVPVTDRVLGR
jgi:hypothetical protein